MQTQHCAHKPATKALHSHTSHSRTHAHRPDARALHTAPARPHRRLTARAAPSSPEQHPCKKTECCRHAAAAGTPFSVCCIDSTHSIPCRFVSPGVHSGSMHGNLPGASGYFRDGV
eukprot:6222520-Prymnesium_polylepis.1